mmetsp:Transcript_9918/g.13622  ORF Transcript_9918/g.13622 Transcript_9918/m.13622 type:complete len:163 (-) Transcript_9918:529-1017(-)|eukprot:CAMPEP_0168557152 /NCGR_PEP_ID=MMETSP0413-20121227/9266_1 /TAXON_ID=136452 /ORGANISM="Filamoeba nolandi, Strain NC-AS-23-1" /LENGTH=162 /DNA_ID=CAMNT_0008588151 /DNA_START=1038 /DNA_END=1526 /DNA_ORIENTATION=-
MAVEAAKNGNVQLMEYLLTKDAKFDRDLTLWAVENGHTSMFHWLEKHNASSSYVRLESDSKVVGLQYAAIHGHVTLAKYFWNSSSKDRDVLRNALRVAGFPRVKKYLQEELEKMTTSVIKKDVLLPALPNLVKPEEEVQFSKRPREPEEFKPYKKLLIDLTA